MSLGNQQQYPVIHSTIEDAPLTWNSNTSKRLMKSQYNMKVVRPMNASQGPNGSYNIQIPATNNSFLNGNSMYLSFDVTFTGTAAKVYQFNGPFRSCAALIQSLQCYIGNTLTDSISEYASWYNSNLIFTNSDFMNEQSIMTGAGASYTIGGGGSVTASFVLPLVIPSLSTMAGFPLFLLNGNPILLNLQIASVAQALYIATQDAPATFTINNMALSYEEVGVEIDYVNAIKMRLAETGSLYQLPYNAVQTVKTVKSGTNTIEYSQGLNSSSLRTVMYSFVPDGASPFDVARNFTSDTISAASSKFEVRCDGRLVSSADRINTAPKAYANTALAFGLLNEINVNYSLPGVYVGATTSPATDYTTYGFVSAQSLVKSREEGLVFVGEPCSTLQVSIVCGGVTTIPCIMTIVTDVVMAVSADGQVTLIR